MYSCVAKAGGTFGFAEAHRAYASNVGVAALLPSYAGLLMSEEIIRLKEGLTPPQGAIAIVGGAKFETKVPLTIKLLATYGAVHLGGALANDVLKSRGLSVGASLVSGAAVPETITQHERLVLPTDVVAVRAEAGTERVARIDDMHGDEQTLDIGPETAAKWARDITTAPFVLWNGPMGTLRSMTTLFRAMSASMTVRSSLVVSTKNHSP